MTYEEKKQLIILLNLYKNDILKQDTKNKKEGRYSWEWSGIKAQLNHCRCIENKLAYEIERKMYN